MRGKPFSKKFSPHNPHHFKSMWKGGGEVVRSCKNPRFYRILPSCGKAVTDVSHRRAKRGFPCGVQKAYRWKTRFYTLAPPKRAIFDGKVLCAPSLRQVVHILRDGFCRGFPPKFCPTTTRKTARDKGFGAFPQFPQPLLLILLKNYIYHTIFSPAAGGKTNTRSF